LEVERELTHCAACGKALRGRQKRFCSNVCQRAKAWTDRRVILLTKGVASSRRAARRLVEELAGSRCCALCSLKEWCGQPIALLLDHINGDAGDWRLQNLRLICPNCDAQLPTFKGRNRGKGRWARRERYQKGQSY
jgi:hypothetical protein